MRRAAALALSLALLPVPGLACIERIADAGLATAVRQLSEADKDQAGPLAQEVRQALDAGAQDYCASYHLARHLVLRGDYDGAREILIAGLDHVTQEDLEDTAPWNLVGFTHMQQDDLFAALRSFEHQIEYPTFQRLPANTRMKVLNNAGFTALRTGQYEAAIEKLSAARDLGSRTAVRNLQIANSILETQKSGDIDAPGIFTTVLASRKTPEAVAEVLNAAAARLEDGEALHVFISKNEWYAITYGAYESYLKSETRRDVARQNGFDDAYVTSLAEWADVSLDFVKR